MEFFILIALLTPFFFIGFFFPFKTQSYLFIAFICFILSVYLSAIADSITLLKLPSYLIKNVGLTFIYAGTFRLIFQQPSIKTTFDKIGHSAFLLLISILFIHNVFDFNLIYLSNNEKVMGVINPWGLFNTILIIYFFLLIYSKDQLLNVNKLYSLTQFSAIIYFVLTIAVLLGIVKGNTEKVELGIGGIGLGGISTNETALFALLHIVTLFTYQYKYSKYSFLSFLLIVTTTAGLFLSESRTGMFLLLVSVLFFLIYANISKKIKLTIFGVGFILFVTVGLSVLDKRMEADVGSDNLPAKRNEIVLPGSGRPIIWASYLDAFIYQSKNNPSSWLLGIGSAEIKKLYENTSLNKLGATLPTINFYPIHGDWLYLFLSSGLVGLFCFIVILIYLFSLSFNLNLKFLNKTAITLFAVFSFVDMLNYFTLAVFWLMMLLMLSRQNSEELKQVNSKNLTEMELT